MFEGAFSFQGRIGRLNYFLAGLLVAPVAAAALAIGILILAAQPTVGNMLFFGALVVVMVIAILWYSLSLQVRRIRDIGWSPSIVIFGYMTLEILDKVTAPRLPSLALGPHGGGGTVLGLLLTLAFSLVLYFWPGEGSRIDRTPDALLPDQPAPSRLELLTFDTTPRLAPAMSVSTIGPSRAMRKTFGKRGLK